MWVEESEAESEVSGAGPSGPATLREDDKQTELLMGLKESFDCTNELLVFRPGQYHIGSQDHGKVLGNGNSHFTMSPWKQLNTGSALS